MSTAFATAKEKPHLTLEHRRIFLGFLVVGMLVGLPSSLVVAWQYHLDVSPNFIGLHFLAVSAGYVVAGIVSQKLLRRTSARIMTLTSLLSAAVAFATLAFVAPPVAPPLRLIALFLSGCAAGGIGTALFTGSEAAFRLEPASAMNRIGLVFALGCLLSTAITGATYFSGMVQIGTSVLAAVPVLFLILFWPLGGSFASAPAVTIHGNTLRDTLDDLRSVATVLLSVLLFFQFGNEWAIAGWLPLFLIKRFGTNPVLAISVLGVYLVAIMSGRLLARRLLPRLSHRKFLVGSTVLAAVGSVLLSYAPSLLIAVSAVTVVGAGFAPVLPLISEILDDRFCYHPGLYNGVLTIALTGAMSVPWLLGFVDSLMGIHYVMFFPALGSIAVLALALLLIFEAHLMSERPTLSK